MAEVTEAPAAHRKPQRKLSDAEKQMIVKVLMRPDVNYNISACAQMLGLNYGAVESFVRRDPFLSSKCPEKNAQLLVPDEADITNRPSLPADGMIITPQEFEQYQAFIRQNRRMLAKDWEALGMTAEQGVKMEGYSKIGQAPMGQVIRATHGQLIKNLMLLDEVVEKDAKMILEGNLPAEHKADGEEKDPEQVAREWRTTLFSGMRLQLDMHTKMNQIQAMMAQAMKNMQLAMMKNQSTPKGKLAASATAPKVTSSDAETQ